MRTKPKHTRWIAPPGVVICRCALCNGHLAIHSEWRDVEARVGAFRRHHAECMAAAPLTIEEDSWLRGALREVLP